MPVDSAVRDADLGVKGSPFVLAAITTRNALADAAGTRRDNCPASMTRREFDVTLSPRTLVA